PEAPKVRIDLENIDQRILALPVPSRNYFGLEAGKPNTVFLIEGEPVRIARRGPPPGETVQKFHLSKRKLEKILDGANQFTVSHDGEKMLYRMGPEKWFLNSAAAPPKPGEGAVKLDELEVKIEPRAEWRQMYRETWRIERDFLYDPAAHGLDLRAAEKKYEPYVAGLGSRHDLSPPIEKMAGERCLGHVYVAGGDVPTPTDAKTGLLGADYTIKNDRYQFKKIYRGEAWNPELRAPLLQPGAGVKEGEYLLAVNGKELRAQDNLYSL